MSSHSYTSPIPSPSSFASATRAIARPFIVSRLGVLVIGLAAVVTIGIDPPPNTFAQWRVSEGAVENLLARWDARWYLDIAERGYHWNGNPLEQQNIVFFPMMPMLMRLIGGAIGGHPLLAGLIVSLVSFAAALAYLWRWTADRFDATTATSAVALLSAFPFAVFFSTTYTESLFLLSLIGAWYHAERRQPAAAAAFGLAAGLLRPNGFLLAVPLVGSDLDFLARLNRRFFRAESAVAAKIRQFPRARKSRSDPLFPIAGMLVYSGFLWWRFGEPFAWVAGQQAWPSVAPWGGPGAPDPGGPSPFDPWSIVIHAGNAGALVLALASIVPVARLLGIGAALLVALNVAPPVAKHGLLSIGRFTAVLFPVFVWLAHALPERRRRIVIAAFAAGQIVAAILFFTWRPLV